MEMAEASRADPPPQDTESCVEHDDYQVPFLKPDRKLQRPHRLSVPELLALRQGFGVSPLSLPPFARPRAITTDTLASKIAWNTSRLQNMILTVGPGTPAAIVDLSVVHEPSPPAAARLGNGEDESSSGSSSESSSSSSSEEEEDEAEIDPDDNANEEQEEEPPEPSRTHSRSGSSSGSSRSSTTSPKRTLSDRMKMPEEDAETTAETATTTTFDSLEETVDKKEDSCKKAKASSDEEMAGYSDVDPEQEGDKEEDEAEGEEGEEEDLPELTDRERFFLEVNQAEEHRMQFSGEESNEEEEEDEGIDANESHPNERMAESTEDEEDDEEEDDEEMAEFREMAAEWFAQAQEGGEGEEDDDDEESDDEDDSDDDDDVGRVIIRRRIIRRSQSPTRRGNHNARKEMTPSLRHGGCINTAAWLDSGWRLSTVSSDHYSTSYNANFDFCLEDTQGLHAIESSDCPTQLATSGDDRQVKFWDVRYAMGNTNPLPWGRNTHCPFAHEPETIDTEGNAGGYKARWREFYRNQQQPVEARKMFGNVQPLATLHTGHRSNVFHVTPLWQQPGKVATCGADGYLRLGDVEAANRGESISTSIIISPEYHDDGDHIMSGLFSLRPGLCFSHHFLNTNVGLLCSQRGLRKFDVRLPPRQQERRALLGSNTGCKACAVWTYSSAGSVEEVDSTYVFVGGTGAEVALCDLRMTGGDSSSDNARIVCQYRPRGLEGNVEVSVSGIDLSKDKQELLVSYESDQIYTFPVFPHAKSAAGPTLEEIGGIGLDDDDVAATNGNISLLGGRERTRTGEDVYLNELASYGGHLNRFTFLKNAKYAGPNDEYICTGSDSGHAWIYERATGAVVSLLNADHSTCNGVIPHPSLPVFITYGIDSTAKLWRGTGPVDMNTDDSLSGRSRAFRASQYEMSSLARNWDTIEQEISHIEQELAEADAARDNDEDDEEDRDSLYHSYSVLPDQVLSRKELGNTGTFGRIALRAGGSRIGNDLHNLPDILRRNQFECIRAAIGGDVGRETDLPVESDLKELMRRVSLIRLRHQADRQGLSAHWNHKLPWIIGASAKLGGEAEDNDKGAHAAPHPADLVPDNPSDWIPFDPEMTPAPNASGMSVNVEEYGNFFRDRYLHSDADSHTELECPRERVWRRDLSGPDIAASSTSASENAYRILHETARVLKDGGNEALRKGELDIAAQRYDKAIRYCSIAFMSHRAATTYGGKYEDELTLISMKVLELDIDSDHTVTPLMLKWSPLLKVLVSTRLNLSMLLLKQAKHQPEVPQLEQAKNQARHALRELQPFCAKKGNVCMLFMKSGKVARLCASTTAAKRKIKTEILKSKEPEETYREAKTLEAKAFFRLGSAQSDMGEYAEAVKSFDKSIECTLELNPDAKLDPLVVRRLNEAKREKIRQNKRQRKKFRMMFGQEEKSKKKKDKKKK
ncbi:WD and tetratricopeptide repeats protein 1 [Seminavis robusta]|uniref:WD and tetratricopeptide repeats protein 1 n=1 Tax=Seminavis robusta TaxID=568900 RepID=A0A9N8F0P4_9STRA|nr:WD and tetratricopeptide repeats protein 1 [Seminavis robusta]|eukprot:Sro2389_g325810.1 WD and tetratricopeptide repeats protein 1 (1434) ;mRNA; f:5538-10258